MTNKKYQLPEKKKNKLFYAYKFPKLSFGMCLICSVLISVPSKANFLDQITDGIPPFKHVHRQIEDFSIKTSRQSKNISIFAKRKIEDAQNNPSFSKRASRLLEDVVAQIERFEEDIILNVRRFREDL